MPWFRTHRAPSSLLSVGFIALVFAGSSLRAAAQLETRDAVYAGARPWGVALGDFNGDGKLDAAVASAYLNVLIGNGDGTFQKPVIYGGSGQYESVATADFNGDGALDLVVANASRVLNVYLGNGDGTFHAAGSISFTYDPSFVGVADVNDDGKPDLIVVDSPYISIFLGNGDGTFGSAIDMKTSTIPFGITWGDFNGDGHVDLAVAENSVFGDQVEIFLGSGTGTFKSSALYGVPSEPVSVATGDFRGNGVLDLAVADFMGDVSVLLGKGDGTFEQPVNYLTSVPIWVTIADMNGDGKPDLVVANFDVPISIAFSGVSVLLGNGDGTFQMPTSYLAGTAVRSISLGDMNGDKQVDIVVPSEARNQVLTLLNTGVVSFRPTTPRRYDFQLVGTTSPSQTVTLTNNGEDDLIITSIKASVEFGVKSTCASTVSPGASCDISVTFSPTMQGPRTGTVSIVDSASNKPQVIDLNGAGTVVQLSPPLLAFGAQKVGTSSAPQTAQITNRGSVPLDISNVQLTGNDWQNYAESNTCPAQLGPGASCTATVTFQPYHVGPKKAVVSITDDGGGSPQVIELSGTAD